MGNCRKSKWAAAAITGVSGGGAPSAVTAVGVSPVPARAVGEGAYGSYSAGVCVVEASEGQRGF